MFLTVRITGWSLQQSCRWREGEELKFSCVWSLLCFAADQGDWLPLLSSDLCFARDQNTEVSEYTGVYAQHIAVLHENFGPSQNHGGAPGEARSLASGQNKLAEGLHQLCCLFQSYLGSCYAGHFLRSLNLHMIGYNWRQFEVEINTGLNEFCEVVNVALLDRVQTDYICN